MKKIITLVFMCNALVLLNNHLEAMTYDNGIPPEMIEAMNAVCTKFSSKGVDKKASYAPTFVEKETPLPQVPPQDHSESFCDEDETITEKDKVQYEIAARNYLTYLSKEGIDQSQKNNPQFQRGFVKQYGFQTSIQDIRGGLRIIENERVEGKCQSPNPICGMLRDIRSHQVTPPKNTTAAVNIVSQQEQFLSSKPSSSDVTTAPLQPVSLSRKKTIATDSPLMRWLKEGKESCIKPSTTLQALPTEQPRGTEEEQLIHFEREEPKKISSPKVTFFIDSAHSINSFDSAHSINQTPHSSTSSTPITISQPSTPTPRHAVFSVEDSEEQALSNNETAENGSFFFS